jgi:hypothetical protein
VGLRGTTRNVARRGVGLNKKGGCGGRVADIGANRQSCDAFTTRLVKLVLEVVLEAVGCAPVTRLDHASIPGNLGHRGNSSSI